MDAWDATFAAWAADAHLPHDAALIALGATSAFLEARERHRAGATEKVVHYLLSQALSAAGTPPHQVE